MTFESLRSITGRFIDWPGLEIAVGEFQSLSPLYKFGFNADVSTTEETVWDGGGIYPYPAAATTMTVSSSSANDTSAGTGAQTVQWYALDENYIEVDRTISMNGQTGVTVTPDLLRGFRGIVRSAGSGGVNAGDIYLGSGTITAGVPANIYGKITAGENQTLMAVYTIPAGKTGYLTQIFVTTQGNAAATGSARLVARPEGETFQTKDKAVISQAGGLFAVAHSVPVRFASKTDIEIRAVASSGTLDISGAFEMVLVG